MKSIISILAVGLSLLFLVSCRESTTTTQDNEVVSTAVTNGMDFHTTLPSGLSIDAYELEGPPSTDPLVFVPVTAYSQEQILAIHDGDRKLRFPDNTYFDEISFGMSIQVGDHELIAREEYSTIDEDNPGSPASAAIEVKLDDELIYSADAGDISPLNPLRGLWSYNEDWVLEYALVTITYNETENTATSDAPGHLVKNGILLNEQYAFDEIFGFQLMKNNHSIFLKRKGKLGSLTMRKQLCWDSQKYLIMVAEVQAYSILGIPRIWYLFSQRKIALGTMLKLVFLNECRPPLSPTRPQIGIAASRNSNWVGQTRAAYLRLVSLDRFLNGRADGRDLS